MRLHRFFSHEKILDKIERGNQNETSDLIALKIATTQWRKVFRFGYGDKVIIFDGSGKDFVCEIQQYKDGNTIQEGNATLKIIEIRENFVKPMRDVSLYAAVVKKDTFEWIVEKATELGVTRIVPIVTERSEKKNLNFDRLGKITIEASEQSGRGSVPEICPIVNFFDAIKDINERKQPVIVFDPTGVKFSENDFINLDSVSVFIGPEGGWSPEELEVFKQNHVKILSLGPQILRAETAVVAALSRMVF